MKRITFQLSITYILLLLPASAEVKTDEMEEI